MQVQYTAITSEEMECSLHVKGITHNLGSEPGEEKMTWIWIWSGENVGAALSGWVRWILVARKCKTMTVEEGLCRF